MVKPDRRSVGLVRDGLSSGILRVIVAAVLGLTAACQSTTTASSPSPSPSATPLTACPATPAPAGPQVMLQNLPAPEDLAINLDGRLLFSDFTAGTVSLLNPDGSVERVASGLSTPEGVVVQGAHYGSGRILVAEQSRNRVMAIDPQTHAVSLWRSFPNLTGKEGIDGIGPELSNGDIVVPDSPNGVVWRVSADGKTATQIGSGMNRPAGAGVDADGRVFIADEGGPVWVLDQTKRRFATLPTPDDVLVGRQGHVFVNTLGDNAIHELDAQGHQVSLLSGIQQPQGIALDYADNLYYTEFTKGRIGRAVRTFILDPPKVTRTPRGTYIVCPVIRRAAGFSQALGLSAGSSVATSILRLVQPGTDSSGALEVQTSEPTIGITVSDSGLLSQSQTVSLSP